jgi:hypothetical protein
VTLPSKESVGPGAEEQLQQGTPEQESSVSERGIVGWLGTVFLLASFAVAALLGIVTSLFIRWRNTGRMTAAVSSTEKKSEGAGDTPLKTTVGQAVKVAESPATLMSQNSANISDVGPTYGEIFPGITSIEVSNTDNSAVEAVAQLAELCAKGTPPKNDFQRIKDATPESGHAH